MINQKLASVGLDFRLNQDRCVGTVGDKPEDFQVSELHLSGLDARFSTSYVGGAGVLTLGVLQKKNLSTFNAVSRLAKILGIRSESIGYGGLKDAKALTWQFVTVPGKITSFEANNLKFFPLLLRNSGFSSKEVWGNSFQVHVKTANEPEFVLKRFYQLSERPLPAFYGIQRFGRNSLDTHLVGLHLLKHEYEEAVKTILYGKNGSYERFLEKKLIEGKSEEKAILSLPKQLINLFVNAYQASVFNKALKMYIQENGSLLPTHGSHYVGLTDRFGLPSKVVLFDASKIQVPNFFEKKTFIMAPLPGAKLSKLVGDLAELERLILNKDGVATEDFQRTPIGGISGGFRQIHFWIEGAKHTLCDAELTLCFKLQKGMYASVVIQELLI
jgi:tRNA pseudouridine13 synthase